MNLFTRILGVVAIFMLFAAPGEEPPPPPPPEELDCSPGYWKNHTEVWWGLACTGSGCDELLTGLTAKGPGSDAYRDAAASYLNGWAAVNDIAACKDD